MRRIKGVTLTETDLQFRKIDSWFASSSGSRIHQRKVISGCGIVATSYQARKFKSDRIQIALADNTPCKDTNSSKRWI